MLSENDWMCLSHQEYEATRKVLEGVKREREDAKRQLSALKQAQAPMLAKIQQIEDQLKPTEAQMKAKVKNDATFFFTVD